MPVYNFEFSKTLKAAEIILQKHVHLFQVGMTINRLQNCLTGNCNSFRSIVKFEHIILFYSVMSLTPMEAQEEYSGVVLIRISYKKCYIYNYYRKNLKQGSNYHEIISLSAISKN